MVSGPGRGSNGVEAAPLVMIVDDDEDVRRSLGDLLGSVGFETALFASMPELLAHGLPDRPACLVLDVRMPGGSGLELQSRLNSAGLKVPIIFISGHADVHTSVRAMKAGAVDFLPKPFREQELLEAVSAALQADRERRNQDRVLDELRRLAATLTPREIDVLRGVSRGLLNKQIAFEMGVSEVTVKMHRSNAGQKLKTTSTSDLIQKLNLLGL